MARRSACSSAHIFMSTSTNSNCGKSAANGSAKFPLPQPKSITIGRFEHPCALLLLHPCALLLLHPCALLLLHPCALLLLHACALLLLHPCALLLLQSCTVLLHFTVMLLLPWALEDRCEDVAKLASAVHPNMSSSITAKFSICCFFRLARSSDISVTDDFRSVESMQLSQHQSAS